MVQQLQLDWLAFRATPMVITQFITYRTRISIVEIWYADLLVKFLYAQQYAVHVYYCVDSNPHILILCPHYTFKKGEQEGFGAIVFIFPRHTMLDLGQIYAILEVIILNNDQHQHLKLISTNNSINSKIN